MSRTALLMLCVCFGHVAAADALPANTAAAPADNALYELLSRVEQLQSEVQQLRGVVEEQSQTITDLQRKQSNMYSDLDGRVQALTPATPQSPPPAAAQAAVPPVQPQPAAVAAPAAAGSVAANPPVAGATPVPVTAADTKPATPVAVKGNEKERYQIAYESLKNGQNEQAAKMFEALLIDFPAGEFADNSQYWLAEAYKINRELDKARAAFLKVVSQYPGSSKVPDALLKLGYIEFDLQNTVKARDYLTRVTNSYPGTAAANLASKKLAQLPQ